MSWNHYSYVVVVGIHHARLLQQSSFAHVFVSVICAKKRKSTGDCVTTARRGNTKTWKIYPKNILVENTYGWNAFRPKNMFLLES